jgi:two-component system cell cycle response regulator DivK
MATVLVVEDHLANLKLARYVLEKAGHVVHAAENAPDGLVAAETVRPDLIFMDIQLPGMDGFEAIRRLRANAATRDIPIVALTAYAMPADEAKMIAAGCQGYLAKPYRPSRLLEVLDAALAPASKR